MTNEEKVVKKVKEIYDKNDFALTDTERIIACMLMLERQPRLKIREKFGISASKLENMEIELFIKVRHYQNEYFKRECMEVIKIPPYNVLNKGTGKCRQLKSY